MQLQNDITTHNLLAAWSALLQLYYVMPDMAQPTTSRSIFSNSLLMLFLLVSVITQAAVERLRASWRSDPATSMVIGWDQASGGRPILFYDTNDHGTDVAAYAQQTGPSWAARDKGMNNVFVRLEGLQPNTVYYFVIQDSEGTSQRYSFQTAPNSPDTRLSIIAGSDSRNNRDFRCDANRLVSKLRPHCVLFGGDMTEHDTDISWKNWFDDWQLTIGSDGRLFPIIAARGNHEASNDVLVNCFDVPSKEVYYGLTLGGNLLRVYTLNSQILSSGDQSAWLGQDLRANEQVIWRMAQYHQSMRPHNRAKREFEDLIVNWATLFHKYKVQLVVESDAHVAKTTWPIRPSNANGSHEGFIRDDANGTVYVGEGGWGAPLRACDDAKPWTRAHGSFNQFKWIFVDYDKIEVRTIKTEGSTRVAEVAHHNIFEPPYGLVIWSPANGDVVRIMNPNARPKPTPQAGGPTVITNVPNAPAAGINTVRPDADGKVHINYILPEAANVQLILISNANMQEMARLDYPNQAAGPYDKSLDLSRAPTGEYSLIVRANGQLRTRFLVQIP